VRTHSREFHVTGPLLVVVPAKSLPFWEGELAFWGEGTNAVSYAGPITSRLIIHDHELWLHPSSLDAKAASELRASCSGRVAKPGARQQRSAAAGGLSPARAAQPRSLPDSPAADPALPPPPPVLADVVLTTYEALATDVASLKLLQWEAVVVDQRQRSRSAAGRSHAALAELGCTRRLVLSGGTLPHQSDRLAELLGFLRPEEVRGCRCCAVVVLLGLAACCAGSLGSWGPEAGWALQRICSPNRSSWRRVCLPPACPSWNSPRLPPARPFSPCRTCSCWWTPSSRRRSRQRCWRGSCSGTC
jgi:hypothetical protein